MVQESSSHNRMYISQRINKYIFSSCQLIRSTELLPSPGGSLENELFKEVGSSHKRKKIRQDLTIYFCYLTLKFLLSQYHCPTSNKYVDYVYLEIIFIITIKQDLFLMIGPSNIKSKLLLFLFFDHSKECLLHRLKKSLFYTKLSYIHQTLSPVSAHVLPFVTCLMIQSYQLAFSYSVIATPSTLSAFTFLIALSEMLCSQDTFSLLRPEFKYQSFTEFSPNFTILHGPISPQNITPCYSAFLHNTKSGYISCIVQ